MDWNENQTLSSMATDSGEFGRKWYDRLFLRVVYPQPVADTMIPVYMPNGSRMAPSNMFGKRGVILTFELAEWFTVSPDAVTQLITPNDLSNLWVLD